MLFSLKTRRRRNGPAADQSDLDLWSDDDTLFRLIALGSDELQKQGYSRKGSENVVGPMPAMGSVVKSDDDMWKIIAWIKSGGATAQ